MIQWHKELPDGGQLLYTFCTLSHFDNFVFDVKSANICMTVPLAECIISKRFLVQSSLEWIGTVCRQIDRQTRHVHMRACTHNVRNARNMTSGEVLQSSTLLTGRC